MSKAIDREKQAKRIAHIRSHLENSSVVNLIKTAETSGGTAEPVMYMLASFTQGKALLSWYEDQDIDAMRNWWYVSARIIKMRYERGEPNTFSPGAKFLELLAPLLANHTELIDWFARGERHFDPARIENHKTHDFWAYQGQLALRGDWPELLSRCEKLIADPPKAGHEQKYLLDHQFYLALAQGDMARMETILQQLVSRNMLARRGKDESGFTSDLIFTPAIIYAKIAWRHGFQVKLDSAHVPAAWLPNTPLAQYNKYFGFLD